MTIYTLEHNVYSPTSEKPRSTMTTIAALIVAAGRGTRAAAAGLPKQYVTLNGLAVLAHTLRPFLEHHLVTSVKVVVHAADRHLYEAAIAALGPQQKLLPVAIGSDPRQASVKQGLDAFGNNPPELILIHDAARPFISLEMITNSLDALKTSAAAILASRLSDTLKRCTPTKLISETIPRNDLWRAETPQAFRFRDIFDAHRKAFEAGQKDFTDDAGLAEWAGIPVTVVDSGGGNTKITTSEDLIIASARMASRSATDKMNYSSEHKLPDVRTGQGFDVHKFKTGKAVWICGIEIKHTHGVDAHSDGDVGLHALTDALLGAISDGDIGLHFKNTDPRWKNAPSDLFLADARRRVEAAGAKILNVDVTILCEAPKISPHRDAMRSRLAEILAIDIGRVSVKAGTTETLGFTGRKEGLAATATATVIFPAH